MKSKKTWPLANLVCFLFVLTFIAILSIQVRGIYYRISTFPEARTMLTILPVSVLVTVDEEEEILSIIDHEDLSIKVWNTRMGELRVIGDPKQHFKPYLYYFTIYFLEKVSLLFALFWGVKLFRNLGKGIHFDSKNTRYLFLIGWTLFLTGGFYMVIGVLPMPLLDSIPLRQEGMAIFETFHKDTFLIAGIISVVFGYVFKEGNRIHEEQKLTV